MKRLLAVVLLAVACAACEAPTALGGPPDPAAVALKSSDLPSGLKPCPGSGPISGYLDHARKTDPNAYADLQDAWANLQRGGADAAAISAFAADPSQCSGELGAGGGMSATTFVIRFKDEGSSTTAYKRGLLGFPTPSQNQQEPGLTVGVATGLGPNSWALDRKVGGRAAFVAFWQVKRFVVMYLGADIDSEADRRAAEAVNSRAR